MAQGAVFQLELFHFCLVHLVFASLAAVIVASDDGFASHHACWEVATTGSTNGIVFAYELLAVSSRALYLLSSCLFRRVFGENAHSNVNITLSFLCSSHSFQFHKGSRAFFVTLHKKCVTLL